MAAVVAGGVDGVTQGGQAGDGGLFGETGQKPAWAPLVPVADGFGDGGHQ
ncbi:hypothetical protein [Kitasatospora sp. NPDC085879]|nr:hypothetical protein [Streptomyces sp. TLI_235]